MNESEFWRRLLPIAMDQPEQLRAWFNQHGLVPLVCPVADVVAAIDGDHAEALRLNSPERKALSTVLEMMEGWVQGAKENHEALDHRDESYGSECWTRFSPEDIRNMVDDAARTLGIYGFTQS